MSFIEYKSGIRQQEQVSGSQHLKTSGQAVGIAKRFLGKKMVIDGSFQDLYEPGTKFQDLIDAQDYLALDAVNNQKYSEKDFDNLFLAKVGSYRYFISGDDFVFKNHDEV